MSLFRISPRTLVTENDPLGALEQPITCVTPSPEINLPIEPVQTIIVSDDPILFRSSVQRSATFEGSPPAPNKIHRSETVPAASVTSSLASLGSTLKIGFRYECSCVNLYFARCCAHFVLLFCIYVWN